MSDTSTSEQVQVKQIDIDGYRAPPADGSTDYAGGHTMHSMKGMMLLCVLGMIAGLIGWGALGINIGGAFCVAMMLAMVWMMVMPAASKAHHHDHQRRS